MHMKSTDSSSLLLWTLHGFRLMTVGSSRACIDHIQRNVSQCLNSKDDSQLTKSKEFISRLQGICKDLVDEKQKHKYICSIAEKCPHEMSCNRNCYFLDKSFIESEPEESDDDSESETEDPDNDPNKQNIPNKCTTCNFEAKNMSGLKTHEKTLHKIKCESCDFRTTTKILLKKHAKDLH